MTKRDEHEFVLMTIREAEEYLCCRAGQIPQILAKRMQRVSAHVRDLKHQLDELRKLMRGEE